jgi:hypothetical protein
MQQLHRFAERLVRQPRNSLVARELVMDVIEDMLMGEVKCDPERKLGPQIEREMRHRANRHRKAKGRRRSRRGALWGPHDFIPLDEAPASALIVDPPQESDGEDEDVPDPAELVPRIRERARDDASALQLLALYERGIVLRRDVLCAGMTEWVYRAARERLARYAEDSEHVSARDVTLPATLAIAPMVRAEPTRSAVEA